MKKNYLKHMTSVLLVVLSLTACQKSTTELTGVANLQSNLSVTKQENKCQLTYAIDWGGYPNWFHYNDKGLADEWRIDFGSGIPEIITMFYDNNNRLSNAQWHSDGRLNATVEFVWTGNLITTEHWDFGGYLFDMINTYNPRGQITKRATTDGYITTFEYTPEGNNLKDIIYFGDEPLQSDEYGYNQPNKNPYLAIQGMPYMFLYFNPPQSKWFATSDKFTIYDNGNPVVVLDLDPSKTVMQITHQNYLSAATYFDKISGEYLQKNFQYQNCGPGPNAAAGERNSTSATAFSKNKKLNKPEPLRLGTPRQIRTQIEALKKQAIEEKGIKLQ